MRPLRTLTRRSIEASAAASMAGRAGVAATTLTVPMHIGVLIGLGGPYAENSGCGSVAAARFAVEGFRRQQPGLAPGFTVEVVSADAQTKPDVAAAASAWYDRDGVDVLIDVWSGSGGCPPALVAWVPTAAQVRGGPGTSRSLYPSSQPTSGVLPVFCARSFTGALPLGCSARVRETGNISDCP